MKGIYMGVKGKYRPHGVRGGVAINENRSYGGLDNVCEGFWYMNESIWMQRVLRDPLFEPLNLYSWKV